MSQHLIYSNAKFSNDRVYRYALWRTWDQSLEKLLFIGLNPSTADEVKDDPTMRRCIRFSKDFGFGGFIMANIFAFRSTDPKKLKKIKNPIGNKNDFWIKKLNKEAGMTIAAWGTHGDYLNRGKEVSRMLKNLYCLRKTKNGFPSHPLYLPANLKPIKYP
tara:strand:+ start:17049 stop:17528 length:480 start_codon:yes stop_codon:yes gene_type:complete